MRVNAGAVIRKQVEFDNISQGSGAAWGAGVSFRVLEPLFLDVEAFGDVVPSYHTEPTNGEAMGAASTLATIEGLAGARYQVTQQLSLGLAAGRGLTNSIGTPDLRGVFTAAYAPSAPALPPLHRPEPVVPVDPNKEDTDYDRLVDAKDKCPQQAEDRDGFEDADGCPDADNDKDGVLDEADRCPLAAEDKDGFEDDDGCAELDNDTPSRRASRPAPRSRSPPRPAVRRSPGASS